MGQCKHLRTYGTYLMSKTENAEKAPGIVLLLTVLITVSVVS